MKCPVDNSTMYRHAHVPVVFSLTDTSVRDVYGCPSCFTTVVTRTNQPQEVIR